MLKPVVLESISAGTIGATPRRIETGVGLVYHLRLASVLFSDPVLMKQSALFFSLILVSISFLACNGGNPHTDPDPDCSEECDPDCELDDGFDFQGYDGDCSETGESPDFCAVSSSSDCVEPDFDLEEVTVAEIHEALLDEEISCEWLIQNYHERILWHDLYTSGETPPLNAFVHLNEAALETARTLDDYQSCEGELAGPLHCVPFGIKTNYGSREVPVTNGSLAFKDLQADFDAFSVERLRRAGGVMIGSTAMDEFAFGAHGLSGRSGRTANAYDRTHNSGGSSAGSAVATAANMMVAGLGTDNCSSLTVPAAYNGLFTMRSSHQLVSTQGIVPSNRLDAVAGPMTRTAEDLALFFNEMAAFNPHYGPHCAEDIPREDDYTEALDPDGLDGKRIGVLRAVGDDPEDELFFFEDGNAEIQAHYEDFFEELRAEGAEVIDDIELDELPLGRRSSGSGYDTENFLENTSGEVSTFEEICETGLYGVSVFEDEDACMSRAGQSLGNLESRLKTGLEHYASNREYVADVMDDHDLDALVYPADANGAAGPQFTNTTCVFASVTGMPTVIVPTGDTDAGLPVGMSFTGRMFDDATLLEIAYGYEQATHHRRAPQMPQLQGEAPLDIEEFNHVHYELGFAAFEEVLRDNNKFQLTAPVFAGIAAGILEDTGLEELVD